MLAYSSIAHTGYMLVGLAAWAGDPGGDRDRGPAVLRRGLRVHEPRRVRGHRRRSRSGPASRRASGRSPGSGRREPVLGILMTLFLLSLTGIPPTAGFFAKAERHPRRGRGRRAADDPRGHHGPQRGRGGVLLPAGRRLHVHARPDDATLRRCATARCCGAGWRRRRRSRSCSGCSRPRCSTRPGRRRRRSCRRSRASEHRRGSGPRQLTGLAFGWASACGAGSWDRNSATTWTFGWVPTPSEVWSQSCSVVAADRRADGLVERHVALDLGDDVQEALVVARPDLDDHPEHLLAVRHLRGGQHRQEHPGAGVGVEIGRSALARLAEPESSRYIATLHGG